MRDRLAFALVELARWVSPGPKSDHEALWFKFRLRYHHREFPNEREWEELWYHWTKKGWRE